MSCIIGHRSALPESQPLIESSHTHGFHLTRMSKFAVGVLGSMWGVAASKSSQALVSQCFGDNNATSSDCGSNVISTVVLATVAVFAACLYRTTKNRMHENCLACQEERKILSSKVSPIENKDDSIA